MNTNRTQCSQSKTEHNVHNHAKHQEILNEALKEFSVKTPVVITMLTDFIIEQLKQLLVNL